jgi:hypothetical protein
MRAPRLLLVLPLLLSAGPLDEGGEAPAAEPTTLERARELHASLDGDGDGALDRGEARRGGLSRHLAARMDRDGDRRLDRDEFVLGLRILLADAGLEAAPDLDAEATRLRALFRARRAGTASR